MSPWAHNPSTTVSCEPVRSPARVEDAALHLYTRLRQTACASRTQVADEAGLPSDVTADGWEHLDLLGLVREVPGTQDVTAVAPDVAFMDILTKHHEQLDRHAADLERLSQAAETLNGRYRRVVAAESAGARVEIIRGDQEKRNRLLVAMNERAQLRSDSMHPGPLPPTDVLEKSLQEDAALLKRGVRVRAIYGQSATGAPRNRKYLADLATLGAEVRLAAQIPFDLLLTDRDVAYLTVAQTAGEHSAGASMVEVRGDVLISSYQALYEHCWLQAVPLRTDGQLAEGHHQRLDVQQTILRLMFNGLSDEQIGTRLGISPRTLRRHTVQIMDRLGATSRFQAGVLAAERGLLPPPGTSAAFR